MIQVHRCMKHHFPRIVVGPSVADPSISSTSTRRSLAVSNPSTSFSLPDLDSFSHSILILFNMSVTSVPSFDELPVDKKGPFLNAWGL